MQAEVAVEGGEGDQALTLLQAIETSTPGRAETPYLIGLVHAETLFAAGQDARASAALAAARERLLDRAARVDDPELRDSFLQRIPENARILQLADAWKVGTRRAVALSRKT